MNICVSLYSQWTETVMMQVHRSCPVCFCTCCF